MKTKVWLGILISAVFLFLFARQIDFGEIWNILKRVNYFYILLCALLQVLTLLIRAERWKHILNPIKKINLMSLFSATSIGFMSNNIFPARMGEFIKAYTIGKKENISKSASFATVVVERLFDSFTLLLFLITVVIFFPFPAGFYQNQYLHPDNLRKAGIFVGILCFFLLLFLLFLGHRSQEVIDFLKRKSKTRPHKIWDKLIHHTESFCEGLESLKGGAHIAWIVFWSLALWLVIFYSYYLAYPAFGLDLSFFSSILIVVLIAAAVAAPSSPGFIGTFHFAAAGGMTLLGVPPNTAKSFAIVVHAATIVPVIITGLICAAHEGLNFKQLKQLEEMEEAESV